MIAILNVGRASMVIWIVYGLTLIFAPHFLHRGPDDAWGIAQVAIAFGLGYVIERAMSALYRRRAAYAMEHIVSIWLYTSIDSRRQPSISIDGGRICV